MKLAASFALVIGLTFAAHAQSLRVEASVPAPELDALFQRTNGWIGADGNYAVSVTSDRTLWFFSDTWIGRVAHGRRTNATLVNNSVGVQTGQGTGARVEFHWTTNASGRASAFFLPDDGRGWFWPVGGTMVDGRLHLLLWQMEKTDGPGVFGFRHAAVWHGEVENPLDPPPQWRVKQAKLPFTELTGKRQLLFGAAVLRHGDDVFIYGTEDRPGERGFGRRMVLARAPAVALGDFAQWRFFRDGAWEEDFHRSAPLAPGMASEYSVALLPGARQFIAVTHDALLSPDIVARTAPQPWGPWSEAVKIYKCPEAGWNKGIFCYAGKAQPSLSSSNELVISYAANAHEFADVIRDARLYWPRFVRARFSLTPAASPDR